MSLSACLLVVLCSLNLCFALSLSSFDRAQKAKVQCSGNVRLTNVSGMIMDHDGPGNYDRSVECTWVLDMSDQPVNMIQFNFTRFRVEYLFDWVRFVIGDITSSRLVSVHSYYTGADLPDPFSIPLPVRKRISITFHSDELVTDAGFVLAYQASSCPNYCSGKGFCYAGTCSCFGGYSGADCSSTTCQSDCYSDLERGRCVNDSCQCFPPNLGVNCGYQYCSGNTLYTNQTGSIVDRLEGPAYKSFSDCMWTIKAPNPSDTIKLSFSFFSTEEGYDFLTVYDGVYSENSDQVIGVFSGDRTIPPLYAFSGQMTLRFTSDDSVEARGFLASYETFSCLNGCVNGQCEDPNLCSCELGFMGRDCSTPYCESGCSDHGKCVKNGTGDFCQCDSGWSGPTCGSCGACPASRCPPKSDLTEIKGNITTGTSNYAPGLTCIWTIRPQQADSVNLIFKAFDLSSGTATLKVYDGDLSGSLLGSFTGQTIPPQLRSTTGKMTLRFTSAFFRTSRKGFLAQYIGYSCPNSCNGNGVCVQGVCSCFPGYSGNSCNETTCVGDCRPNGICHPELRKCQCAPGYSGADCGYGKCQGNQTLEEQTGIPFAGFLLSQVDDVYQNNARCGWWINAQSSISLIFNSFELEQLADFLYVYEKDPVSGNLTNVLRLTGRSKPNPYISSSNSLFLSFISDQANTWTGFNISYSSQSACPGNCTQAQKGSPLPYNGYCLNQKCVCLPGWSGDDCSLPADPVRLDPMTKLVLKDEKVLENEWNLYRISLMADQPLLGIRLNLASNETAIPQVLLRKGSAPNFDACRLSNVGVTDSLANSIANCSLYNSVSNFDIRLRNASAGDYYLGVYGFYEARYDLMSYVDCIGPCQNGGVCLSPQYLCSCKNTSSICYIGDVCQTQIACASSSPVVPTIPLSPRPSSTPPSSSPTPGFTFIPTIPLSPLPTTPNSTISPVNSTSPLPSNSDSDSSKRAGMIILVIVIVSLFIAIVVVGVLLYLRRQRRLKEINQGNTVGISATVGSINSDGTPKQTKGYTKFDDDHIVL